MRIGDGLRRTGNDNTIIKSIIWNTIIDTFKTEKNIDITDYLTSIRVNNSTVFIKTKKPIINTEALLLNEQIKKASQKKLLKLGIKIINLDIKYL